jgi:hypothetical protein
MSERKYIHPETFVNFIHTNTSMRDVNSRRCKCINMIPISPNDNRVLRRWRSGDVQRITIKAAEAFLDRYGLTLTNYGGWAGMAMQSAYLYH